MAEITEYIRLNPFRVLGVYVDDPEQKLADNIAELKPMVAKGLSFPFPTDWAEKLGPINRTEAMVDEAIAALADPERRQLESLFWLHGHAGPISAAATINEAVRALASGDIEAATKAYTRLNTELNLSASTRAALSARLSQIQTDSKPLPQPSPTSSPSELASKSNPSPGSPPVNTNPIETPINDKSQSHWFSWIVVGVVIFGLEIFLINQCLRTSTSLWVALLGSLVLQVLYDAGFYIKGRLNPYTFSAKLPFFVSYMFLDFIMCLLASGEVQEFVYYYFNSALIQGKGVSFAFLYVLSGIVGILMGRVAISGYKQIFRQHGMKPVDKKIRNISRVVVALLWVWLIF